MTEDIADQDTVRFTGLPERIAIADGVVLRPFTVDDVPNLVAAVNASLESLRPWMPWAQDEVTIEVQRDWQRGSAEQWREGVDFTYGIFGPGDEVLGGCGFHVRNGPGVLEIGYWLRSDQQGRGLMTQVAGRLTEVALAVEGCTRVEIHTDPANVRSAAVPQRLGYELAGLRDAEVLAPAHTGKHQIWVFPEAG